MTKTDNLDVSVEVRMPYEQYRDALNAERQAGRVFKCKCVRGDTSTKVCECFKGGYEDAVGQMKIEIAQLEAQLTGQLENAEKQNKILADAVKEREALLVRLWTAAICEIAYWDYNSDFVLCLNKVIMPLLKDEPAYKYEREKLQELAQKALHDAGVEPKEKGD